MTPDEYKLTYTSASTNVPDPAYYANADEVVRGGGVFIPSVWSAPVLKAVEMQRDLAYRAEIAAKLAKIQAELDQQAKFRPLDTPPREF